MSKFRIYNGFGIKPTKSYAAAGWDFYIPSVKCPDEETQKRMYEAIKKSYKKTDKQMQIIFERLEKELTLFRMEDRYRDWKMTLALLFLSVDGAIMRSSQNKIVTFVNYYLTWNEDGVPGIILHCNDHIFINSGIKIQLDHDTAGVFLNKSGRGIKGFDIRAQVVDEDYSGYVHLSQAYTKDNTTDGIIYAGDKITQMLLLPLIHKDECEELTDDEYMKYFINSERGDNGFGSTDNKK